MPAPRPRPFKSTLPPFCPVCLFFRLPNRRCVYRSRLSRDRLDLPLPRHLALRPRLARRAGRPGRDGRHSRGGIRPPDHEECCRVRDCTACCASLGPTGADGAHRRVCRHLHACVSMDDAEGASLEPITVGQVRAWYEKSTYLVGKRPRSLVLSPEWAAAALAALRDDDGRGRRLCAASSSLSTRCARRSAPSRRTSTRCTSLTTFAKKIDLKSREC